MAVPDSRPVDRVELPEDLANGLIREFMEIPEDSPYWDPAGWGAERALLNRVFRMGQAREREWQAMTRPG